MTSSFCDDRQVRVSQEEERNGSPAFENNRFAEVSAWTVCKQTKRRTERFGFSFILRLLFYFPICCFTSLIFRFHKCSESCHSFRFFRLFFWFLHAFQLWLSVFTGVINTADGSSLVRLGKTTVTCGIKLEVGPVNEETPNQGKLSQSRGFLLSVLFSCFFPTFSFPFACCLLALTLSLLFLTFILLSLFLPLFLLPFRLLSCDSYDLFLLLPCFLTSSFLCDSRSSLLLSFPFILAVVVSVHLVSLLCLPFFPLVVSVHLTPLASSKYSLGKPCEQAVIMSHILQEAVIRYCRTGRSGTTDTGKEAG